MLYSITLELWASFPFEWGASEMVVSFFFFLSLLYLLVYFLRFCCFLETVFCLPLLALNSQQSPYPHVCWYYRPAPPHQVLVFSSPFVCLFVCFWRDRLLGQTFLKPLGSWRWPRTPSLYFYFSGKRMNHAWTRSLSFTVFKILFLLRFFLNTYYKIK